MTIRFKVQQNEGCFVTRTTGVSSRMLQFLQDRDDRPYYLEGKQQVNFHCEFLAKE